MISHLQCWLLGYNGRSLLKVNSTTGLSVKFRASETESETVIVSINVKYWQFNSVDHCDPSWSNYWLEVQSSQFIEEFYYFDEKSFVCRIPISDRRKTTLRSNTSNRTFKTKGVSQNQSQGLGGGKYIYCSMKSLKGLRK